MSSPQGPRTFVSSIPIKEVEDILRQVNAHPRDPKLDEPFPDLDLAVKRFIAAIETHNDTVETLHTHQTLTPKNQRDFHEKLQTRLTKLATFLEEAPKEYLERLHHHQVNTQPLEDRLAKKNDYLFADRNSAEPMPPQKLINILKAYGDAARHFEANPINTGRKDNHRDDLKQLIHFLFEMYAECAGRKPGYSYGPNEKDVLTYKSDFVLLIELAEPFARLNHKDDITNNAIGEGIKSVKKERS